MRKLIFAVPKHCVKKFDFNNAHKKFKEKKYGNFKMKVILSSYPFFCVKITQILKNAKMYSNGNSKKEFDHKIYPTENV